jgi:hypothetical protein
MQSRRCAEDDYNMQSPPFPNRSHLSSKQEQTLIALYKRMNSAEIRSRLAGTGLIPLARGVAENELQQRQARADAGVAANAHTDEPAGMPPLGKPSKLVVAFRLSMVAILVITILVGAALLLPKLALLIGAVTVFVVAMSISKAFPLFGKVVGGLLLASPLAICAMLIYSYRTSQWGVGEVMLMCMLAFAYSGIAAMVGAVMYGAAKEQG